ncbi:sulfatase-modifying factor 1 domain protein [Mycobacterium xenopi 3993]|nr:sulfatase-modifying factor 1 domain protein [Mycobacterium xenopi 3993]
MAIVPLRNILPGAHHRARGSTTPSCSGYSSRWGGDGLVHLCLGPPGQLKCADDEARATLWSSYPGIMLTELVELPAERFVWDRRASIPKKLPSIPPQSRRSRWNGIR